MKTSDTPGSFRDLVPEVIDKLLGPETIGVANRNVLNRVWKCRPEKTH